MLHASCFSSCYFLSFRGQHGRGEAQGDAEHGREAAQPWHNAQGTQQLPGAGNHLLKETSEIFSFSWMVFVGCFTLGSKAGTSSLALGCTPTAPVQVLGCGSSSTTSAPYPSSDIVLFLKH